MNKFKKVFLLVDDYPEQIFINNRKYQRFLGCYLPCELYQLMREQLTELNNIRLDGNFVNWDYNVYIIKKLVDYSNIKRGNKLLDFGCGNKFSEQLLYDYDSFFIDIDGWNNIKNIGFDAIISSFVFDFNITEDDIKNIYDHLNMNCKLVFNSYKFWDKGNHFQKICSFLGKIGFNYCIKKELVPNRFDKVRHKIDTFVIATKS